MAIDQIRDFLGLCTLIGMGLLLFWFFMLVLAKGFVFGLHQRWFGIESSRLDELHYQGMTFFKLLIFVFNLVPYLALCIIA